MQLHADDGRARDPGGSPFACESGCARPRERRAVGAPPNQARDQSRSWLPLAETKRARLPSCWRLPHPLSNDRGVPTCTPHGRLVVTFRVGVGTPYWWHEAAGANSREERSCLPLDE